MRHGITRKNRIGTCGNGSGWQDDGLKQTVLPDGPFDQVAVPVVRWLELVGGVVAVVAEHSGEAPGFVTAATCADVGLVESEGAHFRTMNRAMVRE
jgi:hypothetical protein